MATAVAIAALSGVAASAVPPSGCTSIENIPVDYSITYGAAIQGLFDNFSTNGGTAGCADCHTNPASGAAGHLDLTAGVSWSHLVNVPSYEDAGILYVVPNHPEQSLLFQKVNCDTPAIGARMPLGGYGGGLTAEQQALIYDWIAGGAPATTTDGIFRNGFDLRGFAQ